MPQQCLPLFTWGYYGWGNHSPYLVEAVDAVEKKRGFEPPLFVDIRIRRNVRAKGFTGTAFEQLLGENRHRWLRSLGNRFIETRTGPEIQIVDPEAANELLDMAIAEDEQGRRLLYFCSCQWPRHQGQVHCHRATVAELVLEAARQRNMAVEVVEWPGGAPRRIDLPVSETIVRAVAKGRKSVPLESAEELAEYAGLPWCSIATLRGGDRSLHAITGPAMRQSAGWSLPVLSPPIDLDGNLDAYQGEATRLRSAWGLDSMTTGCLMLKSMIADKASSSK